MLNPDRGYAVGLPNGHTWYYKRKKNADKAALLARALAAMPVRKHKHGGHTSLGKFGQQTALAKELGYYFKRGNRAGLPNHLRIYSLLNHGHLPRSPERIAKIKELAARVPENWFESCPCLAEHEAEHRHTAA